MSPRNTTTGTVHENMIRYALDQGGYSHQNQVILGQRLGCGRHKVDVVAEKQDRRILISLKWQQTSGTAEQKVPFEVICMVEALRIGNYAAAYVVLGGQGWTLRDFYVRGGLRQYIPDSDKVAIVTLEQFVALANQGKL